MSFLEQYKEALWEEYRYLSKANPHIPLFDGKFEYEEKDGWVYSFTLNKELSVPYSIDCRYLCTMCPLQKRNFMI